MAAAREALLRIRATRSLCARGSASVLVIFSIKAGVHQTRRRLRYPELSSGDEKLIEIFYAIPNLEKSCSHLYKALQFPQMCHNIPKQWNGMYSVGHVLGTAYHGIEIAHCTSTAQTANGDESGYGYRATCMAAKTDLKAMELDSRAQITSNLLVTEQEEQNVVHRTRIES
ncbi:hypothetical protein FIBSPDRAFT_897098 [Athelia psychrophila]|uniref:Uncharacterized protein n=1 Tax=Athelia psychrophila TaxID=1759441 RepID=A0A166CLY8_9AGAM|nr:hypothetical protein FIBSPDRAFT_897098 [Fibularhizoctonia sp. CBS 109695]